MNYNEAAILLGVEPGTPADAARKEYVARARILHPDRYAGAPAADIQAASNAMAQLNEAWEVYQKGPSAATSGTSRGYTSTPNPEPDFPIYAGTDVCEMCGWGPARRVKFNSVQGVIIWWRWGTIDARLCRLCGIAAYNEAQRSSLTRGWWGIIAPIATLIAFFGNMSRVGTIKSLPKPQGRSPHAITLLPIPMIFTTPWYKRPLAWVSTAIAFTIIAWFTLGAIADSSRTTRPPTTPVTVPTAPSMPAELATNGVGTCWEQQGTDSQLLEVACDDPSADWRGTTTRTNPNQCPSSAAAYLQWNSSLYLCLVPI